MRAGNVPTATLGSHVRIDCSRLSPARMMDTAHTFCAGTGPVNESPVGVTIVAVSLAQLARPSSARILQLPPSDRRNGEMTNQKARERTA